MSVDHVLISLEGHEKLFVVVVVFVVKYTFGLEVWYWCLFGL